jgi:hypothetical protein
MNHLTPELQLLINEPLSEPPARASEHWKELARRMEKIDQARVPQSS